MTNLVRLAHRLNEAREELAAVHKALAAVTLTMPLFSVRVLQERAVKLADTIQRLERRLK